jgi:hypothetical protein
VRGSGVLYLALGVERGREISWVRRSLLVEVVMVRGGKLLDKKSLNGNLFHWGVFE